MVIINDNYRVVAAGFVLGVNHGLVVAVAAMYREAKVLFCIKVEG